LPICARVRRPSRLEAPIRKGGGRSVDRSCTRRSTYRRGKASHGAVRGVWAQRGLGSGRAGPWARATSPGDTVLHRCSGGPIAAELQTGNSQFGAPLLNRRSRQQKIPVGRMGMVGGMGGGSANDSLTLTRPTEIWRAGAPAQKRRRPASRLSVGTAGGTAVVGACGAACRPQRAVRRGGWAQRCRARLLARHLRPLLVIIGTTWTASRRTPSRRSTTIS
jgi:hypothetical protein